MSLGMKKSESKYTLKEKLDIAESVSTVLMFLMAIWGTIAAYEEGLWHKLSHIVDHYHQELVHLEQTDNLSQINAVGLKNLEKDIKLNKK